MADDLPHNGASFEIPPSVEMETEPEPEPEILPLGVCPFDPATYHPQIHVLPPKGIRHFIAFARRASGDLLL